MRPRGKVRALLLSSAWEAACSSPWRAATWRDAWRVAGSLSEREVRTTWDNMVRAGELAVVGSLAQVSHGRPLRLCVPATPAATSVADAAQDLQRAMAAWSGER